MVARSKRRKLPAAEPVTTSASAPFPGFALPGALMFAGVFLLYAGSYHYPLVFDDRLINRIQLPDMAAACMALKIRCLSDSTFGLSYLTAGFNLFWFRAGNVLCHALATLACFLFLDRLFEAALRGRSDGAGEFSPARGRLLAFCGALLFAVHPVTVYGIAYLIQRSIVMATLFSLLSLAAFVHALSGGGRRWLWLSVLLYGAALWSKEHAVMLPAVAIAIAVLLGKRVPGSRLERLALLMVIVGAGVLMALKLEFVIGRVYEYYTRELSLFQSAGGAALDPASAHLASAVTQAFLFFKYLLLWLVPYPGWMSVDLRQPLAGGPLTWPYGLAAPAFLAFGAAAAVLVLRRGAPGLLGLGLLFPWLLFFTEFVTARIQEPFVLYRSYLWMAGLPAILPFLVARLPARSLVAGCAAIALILGVAMRDRLATFASEFALWDDVVRKNTDLSLPFVDRGYDNRAAALLRERRPDAALSDVEIALKLNPRSSHAYVNRALALAQLGERERALADLDRAIELDPSFANAHAERCLLLIRMEEPARALESCNAALRLAPALLNRAVLHIRARRWEAALADVGDVLKYEPTSPAALYNRGRIYRELGRAAESERDLRASCRAGLAPACATLRETGRASDRVDGGNR